MGKEAAVYIHTEALGRGVPIADQFHLMNHLFTWSDGDFHICVCMYVCHM